MTVQFKAIENALALKLKEICKRRFKVYSNTVIENFTAPCFFISTRLADFETVNINTVKLTVSCNITFFPPIENDQRIRDEQAALQLMNILPNRLHPSLAVGDRYLITTGGNFSYGGENNDLLRYSFNFEYYDEAVPADVSDGEKILKMLELKLRTVINTEQSKNKK